MVEIHADDAQDLGIEGIEEETDVVVAKYVHRYYGADLLGIALVVVNVKAGYVFPTEIYTFLSAEDQVKEEALPPEADLYGIGLLPDDIYDWLVNDDTGGLDGVSLGKPTEYVVNGQKFLRVEIDSEYAEDYGISPDSEPEEDY